MLKEILNNLVDNVKSKIQKINIANYNNSDIIGLKRIKCDKRCYIYYKDFIELSERYKNLVELINNTHKNGIIIVLLNNDIFDIINNPNEINRYIFNKIGSNEIISSIILIKNVDSGKATKEINNLIEDFNIIKEEYKYIPIRKLSENNCGNDKWTGHYLINIKGGNNKNKDNNSVQLANNINNYCCEFNCDMNTYKLIYDLFKIRDSEKLLKNRDKEIINKFNKYYEELCFKHNIEINKEDCLICPISIKEIKYEDIDEIQICHLTPISRYQLEVDEKYGIISSQHYKNLAWGFKQANMFQYNYTLEDTHKFNIEMTINILKDDYKINKDEKINELINGLIDYLGK